MEKGPAQIMAEARAVVGDGPTYVSVHIDMLDPVYAPGTGTPEIGGFTTFQAQQMLRGLRGVNTVRAVLELGLGALVLPDQFAVPKAAEAFEDNGHLKNKESQETFKRLIQKLARAAHVLHGSP